MRLPKHERVARTLRGRIKRGTYEVGERLPTQDALAVLFGVSRHTVVRALGQLREEGWIETRKGSGSRVMRKGPQPG